MGKCENLNYLWNGKNGGIGLKGKKRYRNEVGRRGCAMNRYG